MAVVKGTTGKPLKLIPELEISGIEYTQFYVIKDIKRKLYYFRI